MQMGFWHIQGRHEVDFVIEAAGRRIAIEIKSSARWETNDLAGLKAFLAKTSKCMAGILAYNGTSAVSLGNKLWAVPLTTIMS